MKLNEQITQLRRERKMSQEELAEILQVSRQSVSKWENGLSNPDTENLIRLAEIFQVDVNLLIGSQLQPDESSVETTPSAPSDQRKTVRLLSTLLALAVCATIVFAVLWVTERSGNNSSEVDPQGGMEMWWDSLEMRSGLLGEEIDLTSEEKKAMVEYISRFHFVEKTEENQDEHYGAGGRMYTVEYTKDGVFFHWYFTESQTQYTVTMPDGQKMSYGYCVDYTILYELDRYAN